ncbi:MAG: molybdopterin-synthase adenylyltransferase MoeB [Marinicaulis sp.]|nr:molybdopterin-synthase adenylyltransferase MoeB [Marinicaulis sp.]NNE41687.1 molybdopterin-synthase adenylyltransferase MoeB [Marinicaulis sp.]NNL88996.1 molybdopterin-synthase adenylyltransferase MoeB [Marinicaulis sp.]
MNEDELTRYSRHILLKEIGGQGQKNLLDAKVLIVGAGGLGAPIIEYLTAAGVGELHIADDDVVSLSNLQRQVIFRTDDIGRAKVDAAGDFINALNPGVKFKPLNLRIDDTNARNRVSDVDFVVEGVDNFATRYALNTACIAARTPLVSAAVGRFEGQVATFKPFEAPGVLPCYRCLTPEEPPLDQQVNCAEEGVLGAVTGVVGALAAMEVIKEITGVGESLAGRLLIYDGLAAQTRTVKLSADPACDCGAEAQQR